MSLGQIHTGQEAVQYYTKGIQILLCMLEKHAQAIVSTHTHVLWILLNACLTQNTRRSCFFSLNTSTDCIINWLSQTGSQRCWILLPQPSPVTPGWCRSWGSSLPTPGLGVRDPDSQRLVCGLLFCGRDLLHWPLVTQKSYIHFCYLKGLLCIEFTDLCVCVFV